MPGATVALSMMGDSGLSPVLMLTWYYDVSYKLFLFLLHSEDFGISYAINNGIKRFVKFVLSSSNP